MNTKLIESLLEIISSLSEAEQSLLYERLKTRQKPIEFMQPSLRDEPFIGMWKNREDLQDSSQWVRQVRQQEW